MEFSHLQALVIKIVQQYCAKFNTPLDATYAQLKLYEEVGEFTQAVLRHQGLARPEKRSEPETPKTAIAAELTDIIGMGIVNAPLLGIDLEEAFARKWFDKLDRSGAAMDSYIDLPVVNRK
jgi:NTP pyrophosphatase (non-canonical NTP hydrolase)